MRDAHYVPLLKGKDGERRALQTLSPEVRARLTPLLEVPPLPWDFDTDEPATAIDDHLARFPSQLARAWNSDQRLFLDLDLLSTVEHMEEDSRHPVVWLADQTRDLGLRAVPVVGLDRPASYRGAVRQVNAQHHLGVCLRISPGELGNPAHAASALGTFLDTLDVSPADADLVIDFRYIGPEQVAIMTTAAVAILTTMTGLETWRSLTLAATGFPEQLSGLGQGLFRIPRPEWALWRALYAQRHTIRRMPSFGDYAITHPNLVEVDPRIMRMAANLRYTTEDGWLIARGRDTRRNGFEQFYELARMIAESPEFYGPAFSWGDWAIAEGAAGRGSTGNAMTWRKIGTSHHLTVVTTQLAVLV